MDRRHLPAVLPRPRRRLASRRPCGTGSDEARLQAQDETDHQGHGPARRAMATAARGGGAAAVDLLSRRQEARRRADPACATDLTHTLNETEQVFMAAEIDGPRLEPRSGA